MCAGDDDSPNFPDFFHINGMYVAFTCIVVFYIYAPILLPSLYFKQSLKYYT